MNNRIVGVLLSVLMAVFFAFYSIYTGVRYFYSPYQTETAYTYTIADSYRADAVAVRNETLLSQGGGEYINYVKKDGEVVVPGTVVAQVYDDPQQITYRTQLQQIESEIELLKKAQNTSAHMLGSERLSGNLNEAIGDIVFAVDAKDLDGLDKMRDSLQLSLGRYRVFTGRDDNYSKRISYLKQQAKSLSEQLSDRYSVVTTDIGGYFCSVTDGYESILKPDFDSASAEEYRKIISGVKKPESTSASGKIQQGHDWYYAIVVPKEELSRFSQGISVTLALNIEGGKSIPATVHRIVTDENGDSVVFLKTNYINEKLISTRHVKLDIKFKSFSGLRVSTSALRYNGMTEGVYVKNGSLINFKAIERIYTGEDFVLCQSAAAPVEQDGETQYEPLKQFDEIIVKGTDLYDGKVL